MTDSAATNNQILASNPEASTWLSANAGSGKTKVLTDRVARLLLNGVLPQKVLCLTYTKAAANEMQNRLFSRLGSWSMMPDILLRNNLLSLGISHEEIDLTYLSNSRKLFAQAIETPGGIKIQTIHSFCSSMLRRFPVEAGVSPSFEEIDSRRAAALRAEVTEIIATKYPNVFNELIQFLNETDIDNLLLEILQHQKSFHKVFKKENLKKLLQIPKSLNKISDTIEMIFPSNINAIENLSTLLKVSVEQLKNQSKTMQDISTRISKIDPLDPKLSDLDILFECFLRKHQKKYLPYKKQLIPTKEGKVALGSHLPDFEVLMDRVANARDMQLRILLLERSSILSKFSQYFLSIIESEKDKRGWLDFDDLIYKTVKLLENPAFASYVLYQLDGGIDHILIDESQDNSSDQWDVIRLLSEDFISGESAKSEVNQTIFAVGDKKQSIYSFQGADPVYFDKMRDYFSKALGTVNKKFQSLNLSHSFRSSKVILDFVDFTFSTETLDNNVSKNSHIAYNKNLPGRVDIWDWIKGEPDEHNTQWFDPVDLVGKQHHSVRLANKVAKEIQHQINFGQISPIEPKTGEVFVRRIQPGDFIILVQTRSKIFYEIIRACKELDLPIAGTDRLDLVSEIAVKDLLSLLSYLLTPEDDLSLAEVLRSPLCNVSESNLFKLAHNRGDKFLYEKLYENRATFQSICEMLDDLQNMVDYMRPYEIIERTLTFHQGRKKLVARLGLEIEEVLDVFLDQALEYEHSQVASLTGFLSWVSGGAETIKRSLHASSNKIRIMTIHGAKGLESPIVILPDTGTKKNAIRDEIINFSGYPLWKSRSQERSIQEQAQINNIKEQQELERLRLLYVSMTRAESWLIICGSGNQNPTDGGSWYHLVQNGLQNTTFTSTKIDNGCRFDYLSWPPELQQIRDDLEEKSIGVPDWLSSPVPLQIEEEVVLTPSQLGDRKSITSFFSKADSNNATADGTAIHLLLEKLTREPKKTFYKTAALLLPDMDKNSLEYLVRKTDSILNNKKFSFVFSKNSFSEVTIAAKFDFLKNRRVVGVVDRLIISSNKILAVDFKSNAIVPKNIRDVPNGILAQMGAYQEILKKIYPNVTVQTAILWTQEEILMNLEPQVVKEKFLKASMA